MVLTVPLEGFIADALAGGGKKTVYVTTLGNYCIATFADNGTVVRADALSPASEVRQTLEKAGLEVREGFWGDKLEDHSALWVAAVAYKSAEDTPGLWVDTYETKPSPGQVLSGLYDEFRADGDVGDVSLEEFIRRADPNVVILSPEQQAEFARKKTLCD
ncbi:MAG TPA: hypothetical protein VNI20_07015 [Fimbriimonadaceae bacterium]|nr:hypothetical protein [Fimbriimonadaceae bacterium]